ncbi:unnamed protein product [Echinostoma caproni]|uniref:Uncharacterized protein n=1 Tax=Echinostoma caproni TaxID=27848 RepID=A0A183ALX9_9TREM|nr:unnamed protein product [Echinostoma caproni]
MIYYRGGGDCGSGGCDGGGDCGSGGCDGGGDCGGGDGGGGDGGGGGDCGSGGCDGGVLNPMQHEYISQMQVRYSMELIDRELT